VGLLALPLSGAPGLLASVFFLPYLAIRAVRNRRRGDGNGRAAWPSTFLIGAAAVTAAAIALYFVGYESAVYDESPSVAFTLGIFARFVVMSTGLALVSIQRAAFVVLALLILATVVVSLSHIASVRDEARNRAVTLLVLFGASILYCYVVADARDGLIFSFPRVGAMSRYVLLFSPVLIIPFFLWEICAGQTARRAIQAFLCLGMLALYPINYQLGSQWGEWYLGVYGRVRADIDAGVPLMTVAERHREDLVHWWEPPRLADHIRMLHDARMTVFALMPESAMSVVPEDRKRQDVPSDGAP
jgi:hypothetical protein